MYTTGQFHHTKAKLAVEMKMYNTQIKRVAELQDELQHQCDFLWGHDFSNDKLWCVHCDKMNDELYDEAQEETVPEYRYGING